MKDPYSTLGVSPSASDDEVKKAYRELARKYHPDNYHDNPLADLASEKMKEINEAYDEVTKQRESGSHSAGYGAGASAGAGAYRTAYSGQDAASFAEARNHINAGRLDRAEQLLNSIRTRNAEWNFLMGSVCYRKGWLDEAGSYFRNAVAMEPGNPEYRQAVEYMNRGGQAYRPAGFGNIDTNQACDCCTKLYVADCCCECMGGDLIRCC